MLHRIFALLCCFLCILRAEYSCDEFKCSDYKIGLGALAGIHNTSLHDMSMLGITLNTLFSQYSAKYGFMWNLTFGFLNANVKNGNNNVIAYDKDRFNTYGAYIDSTIFLGKNVKNDVQNPLFLGVVLGLGGFIFDEKYGVPDSALFALGLGLSGSYLMQNNLALEYGISYLYGFYGIYTYPETYQKYSPARFGTSTSYSRLEVNNHQIRAFIGLHKNKLYGLYSKLHLTLTHLDAAAFSVINRDGVSSVYPQATQAMLGLEFGFGFNKWF
ncbi:hypothetical protein [uncultured Helicobacter sp.]|uniref:hypothetical protein n=3 Tax=uncultured Helicobacter sp. TaxID=175537 RepID=UPI002625184A|nr:hypothetical protein [uncultured Helicobacter sp.]